MSLFHDLVARRFRPPGDTDQECPRAQDRLRGRSIVVAVDGTPAARAAARVAAALARERGAVPHLVHAITPSRADDDVPSALTAATEAVLAGRRVPERVMRAARSELRALHGGGADWPVHVGIDEPARLIEHETRTCAAALVLTGLRDRGPVGRVVHDETALKVMRRSPDCPVLGVRPALDGLARRVVVGIDFGPMSRRAASAALEVLASDGTLILAYVEPLAAAEPEAAPYDDVVSYAVGVDAAFDRLVAELAAPSPVRVERVRVSLAGTRGVANALTTLAERHGAEVIAVGSRRHGWVDRTLLGGVATELARHARRSLLVVPPRAQSGPSRLDL